MSSSNKKWLEEQYLLQVRIIDKLYRKLYEKDMEISKLRSEILSQHRRQIKHKNDITPAQHYQAIARAVMHIRQNPMMMTNEVINYDDQ